MTMQRMRLAFALAAAAAVAGVLACNDTNAPGAITDTALATDLAASSGDAVATAVNTAVANEGFAGFPAPGFNPSAQAPNDTSIFTFSRTRTCYDAQGNVVTCGTTTASVKVTVNIDGTRTLGYFSAIVHRAMADSIYGDSATLAKSDKRTHNGTGTSRDTTTFTSDTTTRKAAESSADSVVNLTFQLPRDTHPWPISGKVIRNVNATITITGKVNQTRTISRRVEVDFPADAQGNVTIKLNTLTCNLNLVTHKVTGCTGG